MLMFLLLLDHEQSMIKEEQLDVAVVRLRASTALKVTLIDKLAPLFPQPKILRNQISAHLCSNSKPIVTHHLFSRSEDELLVQLEQVEPIFSLPTFDIYFGQEVLHDCDHLGKLCLVWIVRRSVFKDHIKKERISS